MAVAMTTVVACAATPAGGPSMEAGLHVVPASEATEDLAYRLFVPDRAEDDPAPPLLMLLHGCTQDAADIARGTRMDAIAEELGIVVLYPEQAPDAHPVRCWNWYRPENQGRGAGEVGTLAALAERIADRTGTDRRRFYVGGISAGGATALALANAYPDRIAAVAVHSGLPFGVARDEETALRVMQRGAETEGAELAELAFAAMGPADRPVPLIAFHGLADAVVHPTNVDGIAAQWTALYERLTGTQLSERVAVRDEAGRRARVTKAGTGDGGSVLEVWRVEGLGHAWSGGSAEGTYTNPAGPDASRQMIRFLLSQRLR